MEESGITQNNQQSRPVNCLERALLEHRSKDVVANDTREHVVAGDNVHNVTMLNVPEMAQTSGSHEASINAPSLTFETGIEGETKETVTQTSHIAIFPWVNADGSVNKKVFDGLVRRVLGIVMQNPGIPEVKY